MPLRLGHASPQAQGPGATEPLEDLTVVVQEEGAAPVTSLRSAAATGFEWLAEHPKVSGSKPKYVRKVGDVHYDNLNGLGQTPNNAEINFSAVAYKGFCVLMRPSVFLALVSPLEGERKPGQIEAFRKAILDPKDPVGVGSPMLYLDADHLKGDSLTGGFAKVRGHEGRHRARAIQAINGDVPTPVQIWVGDMYYVRDLVAFYQRLEVGLLPEVRDEGARRPVYSPFAGLVDDFPVANLHDSRPWR